MKIYALLCVDAGDRGCDVRTVWCYCFYRAIFENTRVHRQARGGNRKKQQTVGNITLNNGAFRCLRVYRLLGDGRVPQSLRPNKIILMNAQRRKLTFLLVGDSAQFCFESSNNKHSWRLKRAKELNGTSYRACTDASASSKRTTQMGFVLSHLERG